LLADVPSHGVARVGAAEVGHLDLLPAEEDTTQTTAVLPLEASNALLAATTAGEQLGTVAEAVGVGDEAEGSALQANCVSGTRKPAQSAQSRKSGIHCMGMTGAQCQREWRRRQPGEGSTHVVELKSVDWRGSEEVQERVVVVAIGAGWG